MSSWAEAFAKAKQIEAEGAKDFEDLVTHKIKDVSDEYTASGGFHQPKSLTVFVNSLHSEKSIALTKAVPKILNQSDIPDGIECRKRKYDECTRSSSRQKERMSLEERKVNQICRKWLKNTYLHSDVPCNGECGRKHIVTGKPEALYGDYSFKSLKPALQKAIVHAIKSERNEQQILSNDEPIA